MLPGTARSTLAPRDESQPEAEPTDSARRAAALQAALEALAVPVFVLDTACVVHETNRAGRTRLARDGEATAAALRRAARGQDAKPAFELVALEQAGRHVGWLALERQTAERSGPTREQKLAQVAERWRLTQRQSQVLALVAAGASNARIGGQLGISERTVEDHVSAILLRAGVASRSKLIALLVE